MRVEVVVLVGLLTLSLGKSVGKGELQVEVTKEARCKDSSKAEEGDKVTVHYGGFLQDGKKFDSSFDRAQPFTFSMGVGQVIPGWDQGLLGVCPGEERHLVVPAPLAYGDRGAGDVIPPGATLLFDIVIVDVEKNGEAETKAKEEEEERRKQELKAREEEEERRNQELKAREEEEERRKQELKAREEEKERRRLQQKLVEEEEERRKQDLNKLREEEEERRNQELKAREEEKERRRLQQKLVEEEEERRRLDLIAREEEEERRAADRKAREEELKRRKEEEKRRKEEEKRRKLQKEREAAAAEKKRLEAEIAEREAAQESQRRKEEEYDDEYYYYDYGPESSCDPGELKIQVTNSPSRCPRKSATGDQLTMHYTGKLSTGRKFDSSVDRNKPFQFTLGVGQVIAGWDEGLLGMCVGESRTLVIPPDLAYGEQGVGAVIPPCSVLVFEVELLDIANN